MDDFLQIINILFCGNAAPVSLAESGTPESLPDAVLMMLFESAGASSVSSVDPDERVQALYPRLVLTGDEGEQEQTGDADASRIRGTVRLEIVTQQSETCPDDLDLLDKLKARVTDLLLGRPDQLLPPMQGRNFTVSGNSYNVSVFCQVRPTGRLPVSDPTMKRWGATYRVQLSRLGWNGAAVTLAGTAFSPVSSAFTLLQQQVAALTTELGAVMTTLNQANRTRILEVNDPAASTSAAPLAVPPAYIDEYTVKRKITTATTDYAYSNNQSGRQIQTAYTNDVNSTAPLTIMTGFTGESFQTNDLGAGLTSFSLAPGETRTFLNISATVSQQV